MKDSLKLVAVLSLICLVCAFLVATAHRLTAAPIAAAEAQRETAAILAVLPTATTSVAPTPMRIVIDGAEHIYYETPEGYAIKAIANGYAGQISLMLGFTKSVDNSAPRFWSYKALSHNETPGLGAHIAGSFVGHVSDRDAFATKWKMTKDGGDIEPITAATISSRAVTEAIGHATEIINKILTAD